MLRRVQWRCAGAWLFQASNGRWKRMDNPEAEAVLEQHRTSTSGQCTVVSVTMNGGQQYDCDLWNLKQRNVVTGRVRAISVDFTDFSSVSQACNDRDLRRDVHYAARRGDTARLRQIYESGAAGRDALLARDGGDWTAAQHAAYEGHAGVLLFLHYAGVDLNECSVTDAPRVTGHGWVDTLWTVADCAAFGGHVTCLRTLHLLGIDVRTEGVVQTAALHGHLDCLRYLHRIGADLLHVNADGDSAVSSAAYYAHPDCLRFLTCELGIRQFDSSRQQVSCAQCVARRGCVGSLRLLHDAGADMNGAADFAAANGHLDCLKFLHSAGVDVLAPRSYGATSAHAAAMNGHLDVLEWLRSLDTERFDRIDRQPSPTYFRTVAESAALKGHIVCVRYLHNVGIDVNRSNRGRSVAHDVRLAGHDACANFIESVNTAHDRPV